MKDSRCLRSALALVVLAGASLAGQDRLQGSIHGVVLGPLAEPVRGVEVWTVAASEPTQVLARTRTDGEGAFSIGKLALDVMYQICATAPGCTVGLDWFTLDSRHRRGAVRVRLWDAATVRGQLVDGSGAAVAGARVQGSRSSGGNLVGFCIHPECTTDEKGRFELPGIPLGAYRLIAVAPRSAMLEQTGVLTQDVSVKLVMPGEGGMRIALQVDGLPDELQSPSRVWIYPTREGTGFWVPRSLSHSSLDAAGRWRVEGLVGADWKLAVDVAGYTISPPRVKVASGEATTELRFAAVPKTPHTVRGHIRTRDGRPVTGAMVECVMHSTVGLLHPTPERATTDAAGRFTIDIALGSDERYGFQLLDDQLALESEPGRHQPDRADRPFELIAAPARVVRGHVVDGAGRPVPFRWLTLRQRAEGAKEWQTVAETMSKHGGTFDFSGVIPIGARFQVTVETSLRAPVTRSFAWSSVGATGLGVEIPAEAVVRGTLRDAAGEPLVGQVLTMGNFRLSGDGQIDGRWNLLLTDRDGRFVYTGVTPGGHRIDLLGREARESLTELFELRPGQNLELDLKSATR